MHYPYLTSTYLIDQRIHAVFFAVPEPKCAVFCRPLIKRGNKSNKAVLRMLGRIQKSGCTELKQQFPENPNAWSAADDAALDQQL